VYIGNQLADTLNAHAGDGIQLYVDGHVTNVTVRDVLDTEVNPSISGHGPIVNSVLMPIATMRTVIGHATGYNLIFLRNRGAGGFDDLGPNGATGDEVTASVGTSGEDNLLKLVGVLQVDTPAAGELKALLAQPEVAGPLTSLALSLPDGDPVRGLFETLYVEIQKPDVSLDFKALV